MVHLQRENLSPADKHSASGARSSARWARLRVVGQAVQQPHRARQHVCPDAFRILWSTTHSESPEEHAPGSWHRPYPSAGGRLGCEFYVIAQNVSDLRSGVYSYGVGPHALTRLRPRVTEEVMRFIFGAGWVTKTCALVVTTLSMNRLETKYGQRGYRYGLIESGGAVQTACLVAGASSIGTCVLGGFADVPLGQLLLCTPNSEVPVSVIAFSQIEEGC